MGFTATHTIDGIPVERRSRPPTGSPLDRIPIYVDSYGREWKPHNGGPAIALSPEEVELLPEPVHPLPPEPGTKVSIATELAAAVLRVAAYPTWGGGIPSVTTVSGHSADLEGYRDGFATVRICYHTPTGGVHYRVKVPTEFSFEVIE